MRRLLSFDHGVPDPSPRSGTDRETMSFSDRCAFNAIETGARVLAGAPLHPKQLLDRRTNELVWASQETGWTVDAPF